MRLALGCSLALVAALPLAAESEAAKRWWSHVSFLADDKLEGRAPGTEGHTAAVKYVARQFDTLKLKPAGKGGFFQPVPFARRQLNEAESTLELIRNGKAQPLVFGRDANLIVRGESGRLIEADLVFVGNGLVVPEAGVDDLGGLDLKGKIAVVLRGAPKRIPGPLSAHAQSTGEQWRNLKNAGVIGVVNLSHPKRTDIPWERSAAMRLRPSLVLQDPALGDTEGQQCSVTFNSAYGDKLFEGTGHTTEELLRLMDEEKPLPRFPLKARLRVKTTFSSAAITAENVLAIMPGTDPQLRNEYIVFSAHVDHVGKGTAASGDQIYNGAMDNAAGVATLIEVARSLQGKKLKRSVLFAAVTGEESGLLGSRYLAANPAAGRVVANLNTDMFLPIVPLKAITVLGLTESALGQEFAEVAAKLGIEAKADPQPQRNAFIRSDQYSFIRRGIPSLALKFHAEPGTPESAVLARWLTERYHGPADDLAQPVDQESAARFNSIVAAFLERISNRDAAPAWSADSFFKRYSTAASHQ